MDKKVGACGYQGHEFGAQYPDSICGYDGYLWDADSGDDPEHLTVGGEIPCPKCNHQKWLEYQLDQLDEDGLDCLLKKVDEAAFLRSEVQRLSVTCRWCGVQHERGENTLCPLTISERRLEQLIRFASWRMSQNSPFGPDDDDGEDLQEVALNLGIIEPVIAQEPCGESCPCTEYFCSDEWPANCYRLTGWIREELVALYEKSQHKPASQAVVSKD